MKTDNELIAEFMGMVNPHPGLWYIDEDNKVRKYFMPGDLKYDKSWDFLIPACNKAFQICMTDAKVQEGFRHDDSALARFCIKSMFSKSDITGLMEINPVYLKLVDFIKWYNTQNQTN